MTDPSLDSLPVGVFALDPRGRVTSWSTPAAHLTHLPPHDVLDQPLHHWLDSPAADRLLAATRAQTPHSELVQLPPRTLLISLQPRPDHGAVGSISDLSPHTPLHGRLADVRHPSPTALERIVGTSPQIHAVRRDLERAAQLDVTVLIRGETGTGKELAAAALHALSRRHRGPLVCLNCAAIPESLLESELFGHVKGAFTGAVRDKPGVFEAAHGGTLFLDEIGDLSLPVQVKLLRALQERQIRRVGGDRHTPVDVRVVSATHRSLPRLIAENLFREDLYYRIRVFELTLPPLRERADDIPALAQHFVDEFRAHHHKDVRTLAPDTLERLLSHPWPGNIRELRNAIEHAFVTVDGPQLRPHDLPPEVRQPADSLPLPGLDDPNPSPELAAEEREQLLDALRASDGRKAEAAARLGISRVTLWKKLKRHNIQASY